MQGFSKPTHHCHPSWSTRAPQIISFISQLRSSVKNTESEPHTSISRGGRDLRSSRQPQSSQLASEAPRCGYERQVTRKSYEVSYHCRYQSMPVQPSSYYRLLELHWFHTLSISHARTCPALSGLNVSFVHVPFERCGDVPATSMWAVSPAQSPLRSPPTHLTPPPPPLVPPRPGPMHVNNKRLDDTSAAAGWQCRGINKWNPTNIRYFSVVISTHL